MKDAMPTVGIRHQQRRWVHRDDRSRWPDSASTMEDPCEVFGHMQPQHQSSNSASSCAGTSVVFFYDHRPALGVFVLFWAGGNPLGKPQWLR